VFLHAAHAAERYRALVMTSEDTYVYVLRLFDYRMVKESVTLLDFVVGYSVPKKAKFIEELFFLLFKDVLLESKLPFASNYLEKKFTQLPSSPFTS